MHAYDVIINGHEKKPRLRKKKSFSCHLVNKKDPLSSCSLSSLVKMGENLHVACPW